MKANLLQQLKQVKKEEKNSLKESTLWKQALPASRVPATGQVIHLYYSKSVGKGPQATPDWDGQLTETAWVGVMGVLKEGCLIIQTLSDSGQNISPASSYH